MYDENGNYIGQIVPKNMFNFNGGYSPNTVNGLISNNYNPAYNNPIDIFSKNNSGYFNGLNSFNKQINNSKYNFNSGNYESPLPSVIGNNNNGGDNWIDTINGFYNNNADMLKFGMNSLMGIGNLAGSLGQYNLAKKQLNFQKDFAERNLANQTKSYNTELEHQARLRSAQTSSDGRANESSVEEYVRKNKL